MIPKESESYGCKVVLFVNSEEHLNIVAMNAILEEVL